MQRLIPLFLLLAVTGCGKSVTQDVPGVGGRVLTVDEYLARPALRHQVVAYCANDPGRTTLDPNCNNALQATQSGSFGKFPKVSFK
jgi:hypothetical protein